MSYIYEALKRAEDENARGVAAPRAARRPTLFAESPRWWLWALIAVLGLNAAVLITLVLLRQPPAPETAVSTTAEAVSAPRQESPATDVTAAAPAPVAPSRPATPPAPPAASARTAAARVKAVPPPPPAARPAAPSRPTPAVAPAPERPVAPSAPRVEPAPRLEPAPAARADASPRVESAPRVTAPAAPTPEPAEARAAASTPKAPGTTPAATPARTDTAKLQLQVVVYSDVPAQRMVFIDGRRYAEGDRIDAETVVEAITSDGAVVVRRGERLMLSSGRP